MFQRSGGVAPAAAARTLQVSVWTRLMSATHGRVQRNEFNVHLDPAGDRFGAMAHGGSRRRILGVRKRRGLCRANEDEVHLDSAGHRFENS